MQAFIVQKGGSALVFYEDLSDATSVTRVVCLVIQCILGDCVIVSPFLLPTLGTSIKSHEDMATVCGVRQTFLGNRSGRPSCN